MAFFDRNPGHGMGLLKYRAKLNLFIKIRFRLSISNRAPQARNLRKFCNMVPPPYLNFFLMEKSNTLIPSSFYRKFGYRFEGVKVACVLFFMFSI